MLMVCLSRRMATIVTSILRTTVACLTLLVGDTLLNFSREVCTTFLFRRNSNVHQHRHIWKSKWSLIKCLYLWSRYGTFLDTTLAALSM
ncbi:hypothetical protein B0H19DRAFT_1171821 [Mycena capillaripes]|nr:hypothetical protein B0H19DRAFT_1171821 [Mycena capillaripes]